ncbi:MAG: DUF488 family protein [Gemmatimonadota bacterium]
MSDLGHPIFTIGHSTRSTEMFLRLLRGHDVRVLVDVRRFPGSRRHPHFSRAVLTRDLAASRIEYRHEEDLGGRRLPGPNSPNLALRSPGFRAYADHMATPAFAAAVTRLLDESIRRAVAVMCAEALPWRCHRWLLSDGLVARGASVVHILGPGRTQPHQLHPDAEVLHGGTVRYPAPTPAQQSLFEAERIWPESERRENNG